MGPTKRERFIESLDKMIEWQTILETKRDFHIRELLLWMLKVLKEILEDKVA